MSVPPLIKFTHDRKASFKSECYRFRDLIDSFAERPELGRFYAHFEGLYGLPDDVVKQQLKAYIEQSYHYQKASFNWKMSHFAVPLAAGYFLNYFRNVLRASSSATGGVIEERTLMVDGLENKTELLRFGKLIDLFGKENTIAVGVAPFEVDSGYYTIFRPQSSFYDKDLVKSSLKKEVLKGMPLYIALSRKVKLNLVIAARSILDQYLYYYSLFQSYQTQFCIQERHYGTSPIKNYLFKRFGGQYSASIQKNVHQLGRNGFYYDADILFTLGKRSIDRAVEYGSRIRKKIPVGSSFMEYYCDFKSKDFSEQSENLYDLVFFGINVSVGKFYCDAYDGFLDDYYQSFHWLANYKKERPEIKICVKHHNNNQPDQIELDILRNSGVEILDQTMNSYKIGFQSRCVTTFGSTIGLELLAHGVPVVYIDPNGRCALLPAIEGDALKRFRTVSYSEFVASVDNALENKYQPNKTQIDDYCMESKQTAQLIYNGFLKG
jgi:hypothetical protein